MLKIISICLLISFQSFAADCDLYLKSSSFSLFKMKQVLGDVGFSLIKDKEAVNKGTLEVSHSIDLRTGQFIRILDLKITRKDKKLVELQSHDYFPLYLFAYHDLKKKVLSHEFRCL